ncbi:hypothetical protein [Urechidicola vernalis]|uniref:Uncharacterized protein n=1 Tax=Urechidicola vernalis TaxID=3075600 RepID=A0ABU2Y1L3_9FLAO|nr:hypothetical protein [Urechidicola sp. P050]MDT0552109.1 hypothetical protein [Urechidicola sp. P050]
MTSKIEKTYYQLFENLTEGFLFFFPSDLDLGEKFISYDESDVNYVFDTLYIIDKSSGTIPVIEKVLSKWDSNAQLLNDNKFKLIEIRKELDSLEFDWLITEYLEMLNLYYNFSTYIFENTQNYTFETRVNNHLELQKCVFQMHIKDVLNVFECAKTYTKPIVLEENILKTLKNQLSEVSLSNKHKTVLNKKPKSIPDIDEEAIERYLLETQFNVDFSKINEI